MPEQTVPRLFLYLTTALLLGVAPGCSRTIPGISICMKTFVKGLAAGAVKG